MFLIKEVSSEAHIYGGKIVDAESFTTWRRWKDSPFDMKKVADRAFCEGLNNITFHTFASTNPEDGLPGRTYHAGYDMNPGTTWWNKSKPFMDYLSRCSYLLQQGLFVGDVCYYYGDQAPNFFPLFHDVPEKPRINGLGKGYDFDVVNSDIILNRMSIKDGRIILLLTSSRRSYGEHQMAKKYSRTSMVRVEFSGVFLLMRYCRINRSSLISVFQDLLKSITFTGHLISEKSIF